MRCKLTSWLLLTLLSTSCIVTSELEFESKVNMPPEVDFVTPSTDVMHVICDRQGIDTSHAFRATVWDPDEEDDRNAYYAHILISKNPLTNTAWDRTERCKIEQQEINPSQTVSDDDTEVDPGDQTGSLLTIDCNPRFDDITKDLEDDAPILVKLLISDRKPEQDFGPLPFDARIAEVTWHYIKISGEECQEDVQ